MPAKKTAHLRNHACRHCDQRFMRKEHLERHLMRHSGYKGFVCDRCHKSFARSDSLRRHLIAHGVQVEILASMRQNRVAACTTCSKQKKRCSGGIPCDTCTRRNTPCVILDPKQHHDGSTSISKGAPQNTGSSATAPSDGVRPLPGEMPSLAYETDDTQVQHFAQTTSRAMAAQPSIRHYGVAMDPRLSSLDEWLWSGTTDQTTEDNLSQAGVITLPPLFTGNTSSDPFDLDYTQLTTGGCLDNPHDPARNATVQRQATFQQTPTSVAWSALSDHDIRVLASENFGEGPPLASPVLNRLLDFCEAQHHVEKREHLESVLRTFVELYFRYFAPTYPFLHPSTLCSYETSWILLLAVALIGSKYSQLHQALHFTKTLSELAGKAIEVTFFNSFCSQNLPWAQIRLLYDISLLWAGNRDLQLKQQFEKNTLISICRALKMEAGGVGSSGGLSGGRFDDNSTTLSVADFDRWVANESRIRLFHQVYCHECLQYVFLDIKPSMDLSEFTECMPCKTTLWNCRNKNEWISAMKQQGHDSGSVLQKTQGGRNKTSELYDGIRLLYSHTEERLTREFVRKLQKDRNLRLSETDTICANMAGEILPESSATNTNEVSKPYLIPTSTKTHGSTSNCHALYLVLRVLRNMPLRTLYALSGWQATTRQSFTAQNMFQEFIRGQPTQARLGLVNALSAFASLRSKDYFEPYDPVCALTAALYIWSYDSFSDPPLLGLPVLNSNATTIRFERCDCDLDCSDWVDNGGPTRIYLAGVGFLDGRTSPSRILHELYRVLNARTQWHGLCSGLARSVEQLINGLRPQFQDAAVGA